MLYFSLYVCSGRRRCLESVIGPEGSDNCHKFVNILGLRTTFPPLMKTPKKMKIVGISDKKHEEPQRAAEKSSPQQVHDCEKLTVDRLMELHFKHLEAVQLADERMEGEKHVRFTLDWQFLLSEK
ncbi:beta-catenin-like protein 1 isoform X1 [Carassius auratus]|uniref:Beta-catenin-like protein 1 isoform X1 n=1 Tax=Carassius auratus TaxID=7957 RepID=A0A6P6N7B8_CARAU|nr:beta-catenin-like protein 1 isoform X1 [Carassius auratus]